MTTGLEILLFLRLCSTPRNTGLPLKYQSGMGLGMSPVGWQQHSGISLGVCECVPAHTCMYQDPNIHVCTPSPPTRAFTHIHPWTYSHKHTCTLLSRDVIVKGGFVNMEEALGNFSLILKSRCKK